MDFGKLAAERYSVRKFDPKPVEEDKLSAILMAGRIAPTACNNQPQRILVLRNKADMEKLATCSPCTFGAPMALVVCCDNAAAWVRPFDNDNSGRVDASIVTTHMILQAADLGLGTTWVANFDPVAVSERFGLPKNLTPVALLPLGYPAADAKINPLHFDKLPEKDIVFYDSFCSERSRLD